jgi:hypothetical protein
VLVDSMDQVLENALMSQAQAPGGQGRRNRREGREIEKDSRPLRTRFAAASRRRSSRRPLPVQRRSPRALTRGAP